MIVLPARTHLRPAAIDLVVFVALTSTWTVGQVTGWPFQLHSTLRAHDDRKSLEAQADDISGRLSQLTAHLKSQATQITEVGTEFARLARSASFTVTFSGRDIADLREGQTLVLDKVLFNAGGGYSSKTGVFTAPAAGLYAFHIEVSRHPADRSSCVEVDLVHGHRQQALQGLSQSHEVASPQQHQSPSALSKQQQSSSALASQKQQQQSPSTRQQLITSVLLCLPDNAASKRAVVRLAQGDTVRAQMRSGKMLLGDVFTSVSGLKLPALSPLLRPLLQ